MTNPDVPSTVVTAPDVCARCMAPATKPFEIKVPLNPKINVPDNLIEFTVRVCDRCAAKYRRAMIAMLAPAGAFVVGGLIWGFVRDEAGPIWLGGLAALLTIVVAGPAQRKAFPIFLDKGPVRFRNKEYNELFYARNGAFMKGLNQARREAVAPPRGELSPAVQSFLRGGFYTGLFGAVVGFQTPAALIGGIVLALVCGGILMARGSG